MSRKVGDILRGLSWQIRITEWPEGNLFSAEVTNGPDAGYTSSTFDKRRWEGCEIMNNKHAIGSLVEQQGFTVMVTGPGDSSFTFSGVIVRVDHPLNLARVGEVRNTFLTRSYTRCVDPIVLEIAPFYPFGVGDLVMPRNSSDGDCVIAVRGLDTNHIFPGECFSGEIVDRLGDDKSNIGDIRSSFTISAFVKCTARTTYEEVV